MSLAGSPASVSAAFFFHCWFLVQVLIRAPICLAEVCSQRSLSCSEVTAFSYGGIHHFGNKESS